MEIFSWGLDLISFSNISSADTCRYKTHILPVSEDQGHKLSLENGRKTRRHKRTIKLQNNIQDIFLRSISSGIRPCSSAIPARCISRLRNASTHFSSGMANKGSKSAACTAFFQNPVLQIPVLFFRRCTGLRIGRCTGPLTALCNPDTLFIEMGVTRNAPTNTARKSTTAIPVVMKNQSIIVSRF